MKNKPLPILNLSATYLGIIMAMSIGFSIVFFNTSTNQLRRQLPPEKPTPTSYRKPVFTEDVTEFLNERFDEGRQALLWKLIYLNILSLGLGGIISYQLAKKTLRPIEESMEAQSQFISDASHELRTPLAVLQTTNEVALRNKKLKLADAKQLIEHNIDESRKLQHLSDSLLDLLKNSGEEVELEEIDLQDVVSDATNSILELALAKDISIEDKVKSTKVKSNRVMLTRVLIILLDNAIKYSEDSKQITLSVESENDSVQLHVKDQGIGIKASDLPHVFRRFYRADKSRTTTKDASGYGLGLAIAQKTMDALGGDITIKSKPGKGSTFTVKIS